MLNLKNLPKLTDKGMATLLGSPAVRRLRDFRLAGTRAVSNMGLIGLANISASVTHLEAKRRLAGTGAVARRVCLVCVVGRLSLEKSSKYEKI